MVQLLLVLMCNALIHLKCNIFPHILFMPKRTCFSGLTQWYIKVSVNTGLLYVFFSLGNSCGAMLFEGQSDHLVPSSSKIFMQNDMFIMAGRMIGHAFLRETIGPVSKRECTMHTLVYCCQVFTVLANARVLVNLIWDTQCVWRSKLNFEGPICNILI